MTAEPTAALLFALVLTACTPQAALLSAVAQSQAVTSVLGNLKQVDDDNLKRIVALEREKKWDELERFAQQNLEKDPHSADWWMVVGYARTQSGRHADAAKAYGEVVRLEPDYALAWNLLAQSYRASGDSQRAVNVLNNALNALRDQPLTLYLLGESYSDLKRYDEAAAAYRQAIAINSHFPEAWYGLARAYLALGRTDEARNARAELERLDPRLARRLDGSGSSSR